VADEVALPAVRSQARNRCYHAETELAVAVADRFEQPEEETSLEEQGTEVASYQQPSAVPRELAPARGQRDLDLAASSSGAVAGAGVAAGDATAGEDAVLPQARAQGQEARLQRRQQQLRRPAQPQQRLVLALQLALSHPRRVER